MRSRFVLLASGLLVAALSGCGSTAADGTVPLAGKVTYDGQTVASGVISFMPSDGNGATAGAPIVDGAYSVNVAPGPKQVKIYWEKVVGQISRSESDPNSEKVDKKEQIIPPKYNDQTTLTFTVPPGGNKAADFTLAK